MQRCTGQGDAPDGLDAILFDKFDELRHARELEDRNIIRMVEALDDQRIAGPIR